MILPINTNIFNELVSIWFLHTNDENYFYDWLDNKNIKYKTDLNNTSEYRMVIEIDIDEKQLLGLLLKNK